VRTFRVGTLREPIRWLSVDERAPDSPGAPPIGSAGVAAYPIQERVVLKVLRWLLPATLLLAGCGLLPTASSPTQSAGPTANPASR